VREYRTIAVGRERVEEFLLLLPDTPLTAPRASSIGCGLSRRSLLMRVFARVLR